MFVLVTNLANSPVEISSVFGAAARVDRSICCRHRRQPPTWSCWPFSMSIRYSKSGIIYSKVQLSPWLPDGADDNLKQTWPSSGRLSNQHVVVVSKISKIITFRTCLPVHAKPTNENATQICVYFYISTEFNSKFYYFV